MSGKAKPGSIVKLKVALREIKPPIWRRLLMPGQMTLGDLHEAVQAAMGWGNSHLHVFEINGAQYGNPAAGEDVAPESRVRLDKLVQDGVKKFSYCYDFGDDWDHVVTIEGTMPAVEGTRYPTCVAGKRACPPEDCGGPWGYEELLEILDDPDHPEYEDRLEWLGGEIDPEAFSVTEADADLAARFGVR
ncbi:MAG: plasmid pRiA4b ORF-3 family protein [Alphaproteobacteria bacterium]|nr:plasmid pRiA4b ORF-3 family protein [Alphaproteobacteria bacterium]